MPLKARLQKMRSLGLRESLKTMLTGFLFGRAFTFFETLGLHVLPVHYYSLVPDTRELRRKVSQWYREWSCAGIDFSVQQQLELLDSLRGYDSEREKLPLHQQVSAQGLGEGYGEVESHILYAMIRHLKPRTIVEIGSGVSTFYSVRALSLNKQESGIDSRIICIEPYPHPALETIEGDCEIHLVPRLAQDIGVDFFSVLEKGDILFIDSSHIVKINSDVVYLYLEVLPSLREGVVVQMDDIPFPYLASDPDQWIFRKHMFWTEAALAQAFLMYNPVFKVLLSASWLHFKAPEVLERTFTIYDRSKHWPASLWIQKAH